MYAVSNAEKHSTSSTGAGGQSVWRGGETSRAPLRDQTSPACVFLFVFFLLKGSLLRANWTCNLMTTAVQPVKVLTATSR